MLNRDFSQFQVPAKTGAALILRRGQIMRVVDVKGEQVSDLICFSKQNVREGFSAGRTHYLNGKLFLTTGDILYSVRSRPMLTILADRVGGHSSLFAPCSQEMFGVVYDNMSKPHPNCLDNLSSNLASYGIDFSQIGTPLNIFMNVTIANSSDLFGNPTAGLDVKTPTSKAGDYIDFRAEMDLIVGITACSAGKWNNHRCTPIEINIRPEQ